MKNYTNFTSQLQILILKTEQIPLITKSLTLKKTSYFQLQIFMFDTLAYLHDTNKILKVHIYEVIVKSSSFKWLLLSHINAKSTTRTQMWKKKYIIPFVLVLQVKDKDKKKKTNKTKTHKAATK